MTAIAVTKIVVTMFVVTEIAMTAIAVTKIAMNAITVTKSAVTTFTVTKIALTAIAVTKFGVTKMALTAIAVTKIAVTAIAVTKNDRDLGNKDGGSQDRGDQNRDERYRGDRNEIGEVGESVLEGKGNHALLKRGERFYSQMAYPQQNSKELIKYYFYTFSSSFYVVRIPGEVFQYLQGMTSIQQSGVCRIVLHLIFHPSEGDKQENEAQH